VVSVVSVVLVVVGYDAELAGVKVFEVFEAVAYAYPSGSMDGDEAVEMLLVLVLVLLALFTLLVLLLLLLL
jgi:hypothetical protein